MKKLLFLIGFCLLTGAAAQAQAFIYRPVNPSFGGNPFNYAWMLSSAQAQDRNVDPTGADQTGLRGGRFGERSQTEDFEQNLQRQILNRITREILDTQFGEEGLQEGTFTFGDTQVTITNAIEGIVIRVVDGQGGETVVTVPYP